ncbi:hypothetical protein H5410_016440 [Solanum commersonii]|uniref:Bifunctional inhibitor/plant lipid transfer protein/seed storage helical domain-containing protein n=1 Tax=Solanum commersonii TaxID=4109 RepID=A0A9J5ZWL6_SOLCO|nr:hypothetical protein H5410_016440 [Solanum commersonii]
MASKATHSSVTLFLSLNLLFFALVGVGSPSTMPCCSLIQVLTDLEAAVCLCTAIRANELGINLNVPFSLGLILNTCGINPPSPTGFTC